MSIAFPKNKTIANGTKGKGEDSISESGVRWWGKCTIDQSVLFLLRRCIMTGSWYSLQGRWLIVKRKSSEHTDLEQDILRDAEFQKCRKGTSEIYRDLEPMRLSV